jgi:hypothetical protein
MVGSVKSQMNELTVVPNDADNKCEVCRQRDVSRGVLCAVCDSSFHRMLKYGDNSGMSTIQWAARRARRFVEKK